MFRLVLVPYLSLALALGPVLCCCTLQHLAAALTGDRQGEVCCSGHVHSQASHEHGDRAGQHGQHASHSTIPAQNEESSSTPSPEKDGGKCPCRQHDSGRVIAVESLLEGGLKISAGSLLDGGNVGVCVSWAAPPNGESPLSLTRVRVDNRLHWIAGDILRACSMLRC